MECLKTIIGLLKYLLLEFRYVPTYNTQTMKMTLNIVKPFF